MNKNRLFLLIPLTLSSFGLISCNNNEEPSHEDGVYYKISDLNDIHESVKAKITARVIASGHGRAVIYDGTGAMNVQLQYNDPLNVGEKYVFEGDTVLTSHHEFTFKEGNATKTAYTGDVPEFNVNPEVITHLDNYDGTVGKYVTIRGIISYKNGNFNECAMLSGDTTYTLGYSDALTEYTTVIANTDRYHQLGVDITGILYNKGPLTVGSNTGRIDILPTEAVKYTVTPITSLEVNDELKNYYNVANVFSTDNALSVKVNYENGASATLPSAEYTVEVKDASDQAINKAEAFGAAGNYKVIVAHKGQEKDYTIIVNNDGIHAVTKDPFQIAQENNWESYAKVGNLNDVISLQAYGNANSSGRYSETNNTWSISEASTSAEPVGKLRIFVNAEKSSQYQIKKIKINYYGDEDKQGYFVYGDENTEYISGTELEVNDIEINLPVKNKTGVEAIKGTCRITRIMVVYEEVTSSVITVTKTVPQIAEYNEWGQYAKTGHFNEHIDLRAYGSSSSSGRYSSSEKTWSISQTGTSDEPVGQVEIKLNDDSKDAYELVSIKITYGNKSGSGDKDKHGQFVYGDEDTVYLSATKLELAAGTKSIILRVVPSDDNEKDPSEITNAVCRITEISVQYQAI